MCWEPADYGPVSELSVVRGRMLLYRILEAWTSKIFVLLIKSFKKQKNKCNCISCEERKYKETQPEDKDNISKY